MDALKDAILWMTTSRNTARVKSSNASAESFTLQVYRISCRGGKSVLITLWKNNLNYAKDVAMVYINSIVTVIILSERKIGIIVVLSFVVLYKVDISTI